MNTTTNETTTKLKILIADDSFTYRMTIQELLEDNDYEVVIAEDGLSAVKIIQNETPDLAILDIVMPGMDGVEVCQFIKDNPQTQHIPVILLTSKDASTDKIQGLDAGADDYLTKPFNEEELLAKLNSLLRFRSMQSDMSYAVRKKSVVMVADDSLTVRMQLGELLEETGYKSLLVEDGQEALETVNRYLPDLVILDVVMPRMDGIEACRRIKNNPATQQIPVIIITSKNNIEDKIQGLNAGADDYLFKPYNPQEFSAKINAIFRMKKIQLEAERNILARTNLELQGVNEKLKDTQSQLVQNEKMVALGQLVAGIAHEINNPLSFVINNMQIVQQTLDDYKELIQMYQQTTSTEQPETIAQAKSLEAEIDLPYITEHVPILFKDVNDGLERIRRIVLDLRNFSRLDEAERKRVNLVEGIESTLNLLHHKLRDSIKVVKDFQTIPDISCFPSQLNQVFMNIIVNAIQAMTEKKGTLTIQTSHNDDNIYVRFIDEGEGIPESILSRIFEPFFTTKQIGSGTGLGLSISYGIIKKHQGDIDYHSEPGKGTTCTIKLPILDDGQSA